MTSIPRFGAQSKRRDRDSGAVQKKSLHERAYELARSGAFSSVGLLEAQLKREQYEGVSAHLGGHTSLRRDLAAICRGASARADKNPG